jgi:group I intron endonuclease
VQSGVYTITSPSGKVYVGSAVNFSRRWAVHRCRLKKRTHDNAKLQAAYEKYGLEGPRFAPIIIYHPEHAVMYEQIAMDALKPQYNIARIAGRTTGYRHTEATKAKFHLRPRSSRKGVPASAETKARISAAKRGREPSEAQKLAWVANGRKLAAKKAARDTCQL